MIEAVNSSVANAQFLRGSAEVLSSANSFAANPDRVQQAAPQAPYVSPYISWNLDLNKAVLQFRDGDTGDVLREYPSKQIVMARESIEATNETATPSAPAAPVVAKAEAPPAVAQAQVAAAALARGAQAAQPQIATVVTSA